MTMKPSYLTVDLLKRAKDQVRASVLYKRFIDGNPLQNDIAVWMAEFAGEIRHEHTEHVKDFLNELYAVMVDPCAEGTMSVKDMKAALLAAAIRDRDAVVATQVSSEQRDRIVRWLRECQALLAEPTEVPELEALIAVVAAQTSPPTTIRAHLAGCGHALSIPVDQCPCGGRDVVQASPPTPACPYCSHAMTYEPRTDRARWVCHRCEIFTVADSATKVASPPTDYAPHEICQSCGVVRPCHIHDVRASSPTPAPQRTKP